MSADSPIVVVRLLGGVGNQLFQYACAKALAHTRNARLILDLRFFDYYAKFTTFFRSYEMYAFNISAEILSDAMVEQLEMELTHYEDELMGPYESMDEIELPCYLSGNWQSWKYFATIEETVVRKEFTFKQNLFPLSIIELGDKLSKIPSVCIHVRRTDYAQHDNIIPLQYYKNAVCYLKKQIPQSKFYVFSDDPDWVSNSFNIPCRFEIVEGNSGLEDFYLMAHCQHHIIANSTFSWWAAWLNDNVRKVVIAPEIWFPTLNGSMKSTTLDIIPPGWICMKC